MKAPKFILLLLLAAVLGAVAWFLHQRETGAWQEQSLPPGATVLPAFAVNEVESVRLTGPEGSVTLRRGPKGWGVAERGDHPSSFDKISNLVRRLSSLTAVQAMPVGEGDLGTLSLREAAAGVPAEEAGVRVDLLAADGRELGSLVLGKAHQGAAAGMAPEFSAGASGRYVRPAGSGGNAYLVAEPFADLQTSASSWIDPQYVRPGPAKRIQVKAAGKDRSWTLEREAAGAPWQLAGLRKNETLDSSKLLSLDSLLGGLSVADVPDGPEDARLKPLQEKPVTIVADSFEGLRYTFTVGEGGADHLPVRLTVAELPGTTAEETQARADKLAQAQGFEGKAVFIPRNFLEPFLAPRASLVANVAAPSPTPRPKTKR